MKWPSWIVLFCVVICFAICAWPHMWMSTVSALLQSFPKHRIGSEGEELICYLYLAFEHQRHWKLVSPMKAISAVFQLCYFIQMTCSATRLGEEAIPLISPSMVNSEELERGAQGEWSIIKIFAWILIMFKKGSTAEHDLNLGQHGTILCGVFQLYEISRFINSVCLCPCLR